MRLLSVGKRILDPLEIMDLFLVSAGACFREDFMGCYMQERVFFSKTIETLTTSTSTKTKTKTMSQNIISSTSHGVGEQS